MRKSIIVGVVLILLLMVGVAITSAGSGVTTIYTRGDEVLKPGAFVRADLRFSTTNATVKSGDWINWTSADKTGAPHTITIGTADERVQTFSDFVLGTCPACDARIGAALGGHFGGGLIDIDAGGNGQFEDPGDSVIFFPGQTVNKQINSPGGTTLLYMCAIHPWMQGTINVVGD